MPREALRKTARLVRDREPPHSLRGVWHRWAGLVDGEIADCPPEYRERVLRWQQRRTRLALLGLMWLFVVMAWGKAALVVGGVWQAASPGWVYGLLAGVMTGAALAYRRARGTLAEGVVALVLLGALLMVNFDPALFLRGDSQGGLGLLLLLPAIGIPVLVLLRSALVLAVVCTLAGLWYLWHSDWSTAWVLGFFFNLIVAICGGMMLRVYRANMSVGFIRSMEAAILQASTDSLTGLKNRQGWFKAAEAVMHDVQGGSGVGTLLFLDLDEFKKLNDTHGHAIGDDVLRRTGKALAARLNPGAVAARIGGEEFVVMLPDQTPEQARRLAERLGADLRAGAHPVTFSAGVASIQPGDTLGALMGRADAAMYAAKEAGRDQIV